MNPELRELLKNLGVKLTEYIAPNTANADVRRKEVNEAIQKEAHDTLWQPVVNVGFAAGRADRDKDVNDLTTKHTAEKARADGLDADLKTFREKHKDIATIQDEAAKKVKDATDKAELAERTANARVEQAVRDRDVTAFEGKLTAGGMDADYAKSQGILLRERMKYADGKLRVMQPGTENIPYTAEGDALIGVLADEVLKKSPATAFTSKVDRGGGSGGGGGGAGAGSFFEGIRAQEAERAKAEKAGRVSPAAAFGRGGPAAGSQ